MISAELPFDPSEVRSHYDELDPFYRELWGEHVHHGFWTTGTEPPEIAARRLVELVAEKAQIKSGDLVLDIGCGYGAPARQLVEQYGAKVTAITLSQVQHDYARGLSPSSNPLYHLADWLTADFPAQSYHAAIAIESTEHMPDRVQFFRKAFSALKVGSRLVVCAWITREKPSRLEIDWLLRPICLEGRIPQLPTMVELINAARTAGFSVIESQDYAQSVSRTWGVVLRRLITHLITDTRYRAYLFNSQHRNRIFALTALRIWLAYRVGAMRYGILTMTRA